MTEHADVPGAHQRPVGRLEEQLAELLVRHEVDSLSLPHIVVCTFPSGMRTYMGPYADAAAALHAARREADSLRVDFPGSGVEVWIALLEPDPLRGAP